MTGLDSLNCRYVTKLKGYPWSTTHSQTSVVMYIGSLSDTRQCWSENEPIHMTMLVWEWANTHDNAGLRMSQYTRQCWSENEPIHTTMLVWEWANTHDNAGLRMSQYTWQCWSENEPVHTTMLVWEWANTHDNAGLRMSQYTWQCWYWLILKPALLCILAHSQTSIVIYILRPAFMSLIPVWYGTMRDWHEGVGPSQWIPGSW